jgi:hypothetical protein
MRDSSRYLYLFMRGSGSTTNQFCTLQWCRIQYPRGNHGKFNQRASAASRRTQAGADSRREVRPGDFSDRVVKPFRRIPDSQAANPNHIGKFAAENGTGTKGEMDESSERLAAGNGAGENNGFGTREAHHVGLSPQENRRSAENALGEVEESE